MKQYELLQRITVDPAIQHGKPCVKGTRIPACIIIEALALGMKPEDIKKEYGPLTDDDIRACLYYAASLADESEVISLRRP